MSAMTLDILKISSGILCLGAALLLVSTERRAAKGRECILGPVGGWKIAFRGVYIFVTIA